ncbi:uncharacterized protein H6S33_005332 [Morchella sextelata]|uniref:uncharacterized protein n=1 Tax=Morchella sextelata TaxID=1174677 RepID=UPI001D044426|nr:uncharacterized protein H6S33_005332 [Morchella sextelata]KAH0613446.1 hypothetical protein H6S33_005332 [Morchella sextelata]
MGRCVQEALYFDAVIMRFKCNGRIVRAASQDSLCGLQKRSRVFSSRVYETLEQVPAVTGQVSRRGIGLDWGSTSSLEWSDSARMGYWPLPCIKRKN